MRRLRAQLLRFYLPAVGTTRPERGSRALVPCEWTRGVTEPGPPIFYLPTTRPDLVADFEPQWRDRQYLSRRDVPHRRVPLFVPSMAPLRHPCTAQLVACTHCTVRQLSPRSQTRRQPQPHDVAATWQPQPHDVAVTCLLRNPIRCAQKQELMGSHPRVPVERLLVVGTTGGGRSAEGLRSVRRVAW